MFTQPFVQAQIRENIKAPRTALSEGNSQRSRNAENAFIWWRHRGDGVNDRQMYSPMRAPGEQLCSNTSLNLTEWARIVPKRQVSLDNKLPLISSCIPVKVTRPTAQGVLEAYNAHLGKIMLLLLTLQWRHNERNGVYFTGVPIVCSTVCSGAYQRIHQNSPSLAFVKGIQWGPVDSPHNNG